MTSPKATGTATLAELYLKQGLVGRAREIYQQLSQSPDAAEAQKARRRLAELGPSAKAHIEALQALLEQIQARKSARPVR